MIDFNKLNTIDDWENLGINYTPVSHKDWTIQDLLIARDKLGALIDAIPDSQKYSIFNKDAANSDHVRLVLLRSAIENALRNHKQNTALWFKDPYLNEYTSKAEDYDGNTYKGHQGNKSSKLDLSDPGGESILGELTPDNTEDLYTEEDMQKHFGEEQAEGLDNLLEGLRDTPHDNRW